MQDIVQTVRTLVAQKRYAEAREFILTTNHPKATEWLRQLDTLMAQSQPTPSVPTFPETQSLSRPQGPDHTAEIYALLKKMYRQKIDTYRTVNAALNSLPIAIFVAAALGGTLIPIRGEPSFMGIFSVVWIILMAISIILGRLFNRA